MLKYITYALIVLCVIVSVLVLRVPSIERRLPYVAPNVSAATTKPIEMHHKPIYVDQVLVKPHMRILVTHQIQADENGVYRVQPNMEWVKDEGEGLVYVENGDKNGGSTWLNEHLFWRQVLDAPKEGKYVLTGQKWVPATETFIYKHTGEDWSVQSVYKGEKGSKIKMGHPKRKKFIYSTF